VTPETVAVTVLVGMLVIAGGCFLTAVIRAALEIRKSKKN
jgi:hypothetical protein